MDLLGISYEPSLTEGVRNGKITFGGVDESRYDLFLKWSSSSEVYIFPTGSPVKLTMYPLRPPLLRHT